MNRRNNYSSRATTRQFVNACAGGVPVNQYDRRTERGVACTGASVGGDHRSRGAEIDHIDARAIAYDHRPLRRQGGPFPFAVRPMMAGRPGRRGNEKVDILRGRLLDEALRIHVGADEEPHPPNAVDAHDRRTIPRRRPGFRTLPEDVDLAMMAQSRARGRKQDQAVEQLSIVGLSLGRPSSRNPTPDGRASPPSRTGPPGPGQSNRSR